MSFKQSMMPNNIPKDEFAYPLIKYAQSNIAFIIFLLSIFAFLLALCLLQYVELDNNLSHKHHVKAVVITGVIVSICSILGIIGRVNETDYLHYKNNANIINSQFALVNKSEASHGELYATSGLPYQKFTIYSNRQKIATVTKKGISKSTLAARQYVTLFKYYQKYKKQYHITAYTLKPDNNSNLKLQISTNEHNYVFQFTRSNTTVTTIKY